MVDQSLFYHQVFCESQLGSQIAHEQFLKTLRDIIPSHIKVTIITDAGFRTPWFREVISYGWDVIGRICSIAIIITMDGLYSVLLKKVPIS